MRWPTLVKEEIPNNLLMANLLIFAIKWLDFIKFYTSQLTTIGMVNWSVLANKEKRLYSE